MTKAQAPYALTTLTYDERNLLLTVATGGVTTNYRYSASRQRYWKKTGANYPENPLRTRQCNPLPGPPL